MKNILITIEYIDLIHFKSSWLGFFFSYIWITKIRSKCVYASTVERKKKSLMAGNEAMKNSFQRVLLIYRYIVFDDVILIELIESSGFVRDALPFPLSWSSIFHFNSISRQAAQKTMHADQQKKMRRARTPTVAIH